MPHEESSAWMLRRTGGPRQGPRGLRPVACRETQRRIWWPDDAAIGAASAAARRRQHLTPRLVADHLASGRNDLSARPCQHGADPRRTLPVNAEPDVPGDGGACTSVLSLLLNAVAPLLLFLPVFAVMDRRVIRWEERNLAAKFGEPYLAYLSRVPRWF
jgi:hypothetical protein